MSTVSKSIADTMVKHQGIYPGDEGIEPCVKIVEYDNAWGGVGYGLIYEGQNLDMYHASEFVRNPRTYWERQS